MEKVLAWELEVLESTEGLSSGSFSQSLAFLY